MIKQSKCPFANLFGKPGQGIHRHRIFGIAAVDLLVTLAAAKFISIKSKKSFAQSTAFLVFAGIFIHRALNVNTALNAKIFKERICEEDG